MPYERPIIREDNRGKQPKRKKTDNPFRAYVRGERLRKLKPLVAVLIISMIWYALIGKDILPGFMDQLVRIGTETSSKKAYYEVPCSQANLARMLVLSCYSNEVEVPEDQEEDLTLWYEKYYNVLQLRGIQSLQQQSAFELVSYKSLYESFRACFGSEMATVVIEDKESYKLYEVIGYLETALQQSGKGGVTPCEAGILATPSDEVPLEAWQVLTSQGTFCFEGLVLSPLKNKTVTLILSGNQVLGVTEIKSERCQVRACQILTVGEQATYQVGGITFTYQNKALTKEQEGSICDLTLEGDKIVDDSPCIYESVDTLLKISENKIVLEKAGTLICKNPTVSDATDLNRCHRLEDLVYGTKVAYVKAGDKVIALQVVGQSSGQSLRVVLSDETGSYEQQAVTLMGSSDYDLVYKGRASTLKKGETWQSEHFNWEDSEACVRFIPRQDSKLTITSMHKGGRQPSYKGILEISPTDKGYVVVNEVDLEDYVAAVIPSEMPTTYPKEALKAQAIAARTYGAYCMAENRFITYGANVDDTIASQVYNRIQADEAAYQAVSETAGLVLKSEGRLIAGKFFAASCGYTANFGEVWAGKAFPTDSPKYLKAAKQYEGLADFGDMRQEEDFRYFITQTPSAIEAYDATSPWFRWQVTLSQEALTEIVKVHLKQLIEEKSSRIRWETADGKLSKIATMEEIGMIQGLEGKERGEGGNLMKLVVRGSKATAVIETEYVIRRLLGSTDSTKVLVERRDGSQVGPVSLLPSAFFTIEEKRDEAGKLVGVTLVGGGNGHGVGLSQDGARGMAEKGYGYEEILHHFYPTVEIVNLWDENH